MFTLGEEQWEGREEQTKAADSVKTLNRDCDEWQKLSRPEETVGTKIDS